MINPSPREEGKGEVGSCQYSMLNHLSPGAGGIYRIFIVVLKKEINIPIIIINITSIIENPTSPLG